MTTKQEVLALHKANPDWPCSLIADELGCHPQYVRATLRREGITPPKSRNLSPQALRRMAAGLIRRADELERSRQ